MMGYYNHGFGYAGGFSGSYAICALISIVVLVDLILLGMWLWKKIGNEKSTTHKSE